MDNDANRAPITSKEVEPWDIYSPESYSFLSENPLTPVFAQKEVGRRLIGNAACAKFFSRRLFIDLCCNVADAYGLATESAEEKEQNETNPVTLRDNLSAVATSAATLLEQIENMGRFEIAVLGYNYQHGPSRHPKWYGDLPALRELLSLLARDADNAAAFANAHTKARPLMAPLTHMIHKVELALKKNGIEANAKQTGALHTFCNVVLQVPTYKEAFAGTGDVQRLRDSIRKVLKQEIRDQAIIGWAAIGRR